MNGNPGRNYLMLGCLATLAILHLMWPSEASQPVTTDAKLLDTFVARNIGPANMSGRIVAITGVDSDPRVVYVAAASGGLWKSIDSGETWAPIFDNQTSVCIGDVAVAQSNPNVIWVGTGEHNARNSVAWGDGVYKSMDGGKTWQHMGLKDSHTIGRIAIHPTNPDIVYIAALGHLWGPNKERGIFKTTDGGKSWTVSKFIDDNTGFIDLKMDPAQPDILYAAAYCCRRDGFSGGNPKVFLGPDAGLYKTSDGGKSWAKMTNGLPDTQYGRCGIDIYRKDSNVVYAIVQTAKTKTGNETQGNAQNGMGGPDEGGIFRSDDKGKTWKFLNTLVPRPFYFGQIRVDPNDDQRIYVLGLGLHLSDDGGKEFHSGGKGGGDDHALWINPKDSSHVWLGHDHGFSVSTDKAKSFQAIRAAAIGQFYGISIDMSKPYYVYGGLQDNGSWGGPSATHDAAGIRQSEWFRCGAGDGFHTQCDPTDPNIVYSESQWGGITRQNVAAKGKGGGKAGGAGDPAGKFVSPKSLARYNWSTPMLLSPHNAKTLYYGGHVLLMSPDRGGSWKKISPNLTYGPDTLAKASDFGHTLFTIGESPKKKGILWTGADDGRIHVSKDGGGSWTDVSEMAGMPKDRCISRVEPSHFDDGTCYVSITRYRNDDRKPYVFKTMDFGETWQNVTSNLPEDGSVHVVIESARNKNLLFCGTEFGLFATLDGGKSWQQMKAGLPTVAVHDLVIHPRDRDLVIGTHGRSIFVIDNIGQLEQLTPEVLSKPGHLFEVRAAAAFKAKTSSPAPKSNEFVGQNPPYGAIIRYHLKAAPAGPVSLIIQDNAGKQIMKLKAADGAGLHQAVWNLRTEQGTMVHPGEYTAVLELANQKQVQKVRVEPE
jgi:photosystem II stability/assembly factor-like uncharacterized protein